MPPNWPQGAAGGIPRAPQHPGEPNNDLAPMTGTTEEEALVQPPAVAGAKKVPGVVPGSGGAAPARFDYGFLR